MASFRWLVVLGFATTLLAGCNGGGNPSGDGGLVDDEEFKDLQATADTGIIRGIVVNEAIVPIAGATISLNLGPNVRNTTSADSGAFGFDGLAPGTYFLTVSKAGFLTIQQSTDVVAGQDAPPLLRVQLVADPVQRPYFVPYQFDGFIACSARYFIEGRTSVGPSMSGTTH